MVLQNFSQPSTMVLKIIFFQSNKTTAGKHFYLQLNPFEIKYYSYVYVNLVAKTNHTVLQNETVSLFSVGQPGSLQAQIPPRKLYIRKADLFSFSSMRRHVVYLVTYNSISLEHLSIFFTHLSPFLPSDQERPQTVRSGIYCCVALAVEGGMP